MRYQIRNIRVGAIVIFLLVACDSKVTGPIYKYENIKINGKGFIVRKAMYKNYGLGNELLLNNDSIPDGYYKEYDIRGRVKLNATYLNGKQDGIWSYYDYSSSERKKKYLEHWYMGKKIGEQLGYFTVEHKDSLEVVSHYEFNNPDGSQIFYSSLTSKGDLSSIKGSPFYCTSNAKKIEVEQEFRLKVFFGVVPNYSFKIYIKEYKESSKELLSHIVLTDTSSDVGNFSFAKEYVYTKKYPSRGYFIWEINYEMLDKNAHVVLKDSTDISLTVK